MQESIKLVFENVDGVQTEFELSPDGVNISCAGEVFSVSHEDFIQIYRRHAEFCPPELLAGTDINDLPEEN